MLNAASNRLLLSCPHCSFRQKRAATRKSERLLLPRLLWSEGTCHPWLEPAFHPPLPTNRHRNRIHTLNPLSCIWNIQTSPEVYRDNTTLELSPSRKWPPFFSAHAKSAFQ